MFHISSIRSKTKFIEIKLVMVLAAMVMNTPQPTFQIHDLLMKAFKGTTMATPPLLLGTFL